MAIARRIALGTTVVAVLTAPFSIAAQEDVEKVKKDLFAVITLRGNPCGAVISFERLGENDYNAICQTGDRYHIFVSSEDRVGVEKY
ncbi:MAG: hypothetical protein V3U18_09390 [Alphaproteobacteria bacterium]